MPFAYALKQGIKDTAADSKIRIRMDSHFLRNFIRCLKADTCHMIRNLIWVFFNHPIYILTIVLINLSCQRNRNPIFLKVDHCFPHLLLLFYLKRDFSRFALADSFNLCQSFRLFFYDSKSIFFKFFNDPACQRCPDSFNRSGSEIPFDGYKIFRCTYL